MALHELECVECGLGFEDILRSSDPNPPCGLCGGATRRLLSAPADYFGTGTARMNRIASKYTGMKEFLP